MLRVVLYVVLLAALFVGAVLWAGNAMGSWEPALAPSAPPVTHTEKATKKHKAHTHRPHRSHQG